MNRETWASLFSFLLQVCDQLLSPPSQSPSLGTSLCEPLIRVLFSAWLRACRDVSEGREGREGREGGREGEREKRVNKMLIWLF